MSKNIYIVRFKFGALVSHFIEEKFFSTLIHGNRLIFDKIKYLFIFLLFRMFVIRMHRLFFIHFVLLRVRLFITVLFRLNPSKKRLSNIIFLLFFFLFLLLSFPLLSFFLKSLFLFCFFLELLFTFFGLFFFLFGFELLLFLKLFLPLFFNFLLFLFLFFK